MLFWNFSSWYLGHIISGNGVGTTPSKIQDVLNWSTPQTVTQLRGLLGLTGYYRWFVQDYALLCQPIYEVLKKDSFKWGPEQEQAFNKLKIVMTTPPVLALPDFTIPFTIEADASGFVLGAMLM